MPTIHTRFRCSHEHRIEEAWATYKATTRGATIEVLSVASTQLHDVTLSEGAAPRGATVEKASMDA